MRTPCASRRHTKQPTQVACGLAVRAIPTRFTSRNCAAGAKMEAAFDWSPMPPHEPNECTAYSSHTSTGTKYAISQQEQEEPQLASEEHCKDHAQGEQLQELPPDWSPQLATFVVGHAVPQPQAERQLDPAAEKRRAPPQQPEQDLTAASDKRRLPSRRQHQEPGFRRWSPRHWHCWACSTYHSRHDFVAARRSQRTAAKVHTTNK